MPLIIKEFFTGKCSTVEILLLLPKGATYQGWYHRWGHWASKWNLSKSDAKDKWGMRFSGTWGHANQIIGHKDRFSLLRLEIYLPWKINQIINKYLLKINHYYPSHQLQQIFIFCVWHITHVRSKRTIRYRLGHRGSKIWTAKGDARYNIKILRQILMESVMW